VLFPSHQILLVAVSDAGHMRHHRRESAQVASLRPLVLLFSGSWGCLELVLFVSFAVDEHVVYFTSKFAPDVIHQAAHLVPLRFTQVVELKDTCVALHLIWRLIEADLRPVNSGHTGLLPKLIYDFLFSVRAGAHLNLSSVNHALVDAPLVEPRVRAERTSVRLRFDGGVEPVHGPALVGMLRVVCRRGFFLRVSKLEERCSHSRLTRCYSNFNI